MIHSPANAQGPGSGWILAVLVAYLISVVKNSFCPVYSSAHVASVDLLSWNQPALNLRVIVGVGCA